MSNPEPHMSAFAKAIAERASQRKVYEFDVSGFFGLGDKPIAKLAIRVPTKLEQDQAIVWAHEYVAERAGSVEGAKHDADMLNDAKGACIAFQFCRDASNPKWPAFPGYKWMCENLTTEQIGVLANLGNEVRAKESPSPIEISDEQVEAYASICAEVGGEIPERVLAGMPREFVTHLVVMLALKLTEARALLPVVAVAADEPDDDAAVVPE